ncbi:MAG: cobalt transporter CbiM [Desulfobacteraceae bacterium]|nr:cobalt transporter CbiM [Desulfobacteraceae bacterium]
MHISEGYLSGPVLLSSAVLAIAGTAIGLKRLDYEQIAQAGMMAAVFFVAGLIHVPVGPSNAHLIMNGIIGLLMGWSAFPVILAALVLQAVFFQFGGFTTLGINTLIMAAPAVAVHYLFGPLISRPHKTGSVAAFAAAATAVAFSAVLMAASLLFTDEKFWALAGTTLVVHIPIMITEAIIAAFCIGFIKKVKPEMITGKTVTLKSSHSVIASQPQEKRSCN